MDRFFEPLGRAFGLLAELLPRLFALLALLLVGLVAAWLTRIVLHWILGFFRLHDVARRLGLQNAFAALRVNRPLPVLLADLAYVLVLVAFLIVGLDTLDPMSPGALVGSFYAFLPRILVAFLILIAAYAVSVFLFQWSLVAAVNAQWREARALAGGVQFMVLSLGLSMALEQLGVAPGIVLSAFALTFGGVVLALALAFGIGGATLARRALERRLGGGESHEPDPFSHL